MFAPMGYAGSSHYFNRVIQNLLEDITQVHIKIDDLLVEPETEEEAINTFRKVLVICREKNLKLA